MTESTRGRSISGVVLFAVVVVPMQARAFDVNGGVSVGGMLAGNVPRLSVSPNAGVSWRQDGGFMFAAHDMFNILPPSNGSGLGVYNQTSISIGYATETATFSVGPSLSLYSMGACGVAFCGRVIGMAPGGNAKGSWFFNGPLGVALSASVDWVSGGSSIVNRSGLVATVVAGPVFRWDSK